MTEVANDDCAHMCADLLPNILKHKLSTQMWTFDQQAEGERGLPRAAAPNPA